jgi:HSP20 family protein
MATNGKALQIQKAQPQEITQNGANYTQNRRVFVPYVDIYETGDDIVMIADMPGVEGNSVDITLEKNILTINGRVESEQHQNYSLSYAEYEAGDYERSFTLTSGIDWDKVEATMQNGVLHLRLPKAPEAKAKKIAVKAA